MYSGVNCWFAQTVGDSLLGAEEQRGKEQHNQCILWMCHGVAVLYISRFNTVVLAGMRFTISDRVQQNRALAPASAL